MPTVIEPLRHDWENVKAAAVQTARRGDEASALAEVRRFHQDLCAVSVLDPACGSGNFLYVTMEHMKRLEGEVLDLAESLGQDHYFLEMDQHTVDPHQFLDISILPDNKPLNIAISDASALGVLSSRIHVTWALAAGRRLGVGNDPVYVKTKCFDPFPFPISSENQSLAIGDLAEELDPHRKRIQAAHPDITLTGMYSVLEKLKSGKALTDSDKDVHGRGLVSVLKDLHKPLDDAVFTAYGWDAGLNDEGILEKLVALNHERAREEVNGQVRWLRLEYQAPDEAARATRRAGNHGRVRGRGRARQETPLAQKTLPAQFEAVRDVLDAAETPLRAEDVARNFNRANKNKMTEVLHTPNALSQVHMVGDARFAA
ncbi:MAG: DNA methyltransferase [Alphaproteobacteria bacterium]